MEIGNCSEGRPSTLTGRDVMPTIEERLQRRKDNLERELSEVNVALDALKANPEIMRVMNLISKVNY